MTAEVRQMVGRITELLSEDENSQAFDDQLRQLSGACFRLTREDVALPLMSGARALCSDFRIRRSVALMGNRFDVNLDLGSVAIQDSHSGITVIQASDGAIRFD